MIHFRFTSIIAIVHRDFLPVLSIRCVFGLQTFFFFFFRLTYSRWTSSLPSCLWSKRIFPSLPGSRLTFFLSRCKFSTLETRQLMVEFYLLTFPRFPLRKKEHKSYFGKNRTHDFRTSRCAAYLLDHSGDERYFCDSRMSKGQSSQPPKSHISTSFSTTTDSDITTTTVSVGPYFGYCFPPLSHKPRSSDT